MAISLQASSEGLKIADSARRIKGWTKTSQSCCDVAHTSTATLKRFWQGSHIRRETFIGICTALEVDWHAIASEIEHPAVQAAEDAKHQDHNLDALIAATRKKIKFTFEFGNSSGQKQYLHWIRHNFIDLDLIEVTFLPSEYLVEDPSLLNAKEEVDDEFDRLKLRFLKGQTTNSRKVLEDFHNIFIYGEPGSGKSTYLQWIALQCREGSLLSGYIPIFIEMRRFAATSQDSTLLTIVQRSFQGWGVASEDAKELLQSGRVIFIFDGFDETPAREWNRVSIAIEELLLFYQECRFIFSSRLATQFPFFDGFQKIIIAPFESKAHIPAFIQRWFKQPGKKEAMAQAMLDKLRSRQFRGIRELARRPILLKMLCIIFEFQESFPTKRAEVFSMGIDKMMNSTHEVETHISKIPRLQKHHVENILRRIASHFFIDSHLKLLFEIREVERIIEDYFVEVYHLNREEVPASTILIGIEQSTGLLVRWAQNLCAFSHLTYQEFFVADHLVRNQQQNDVHSYLRNSRWNFVIGLVAELLPKEFLLEFLSNMKQEIDRPVSNRDAVALSNYLKTVSAAAERAYRASDTCVSHFEAYARAWYFAYAIEDPGKITNLGYRSERFELPDLEFATSMINSSLLESHELLYKAYHYLSQDSYSGNFAKLLRKIQMFLGKQANKTPQIIEALSGWLSLIKSEQLQFKSNSDWWAAKREVWIKRVVCLIRDNLKLPCTFDLNQDQIDQLRSYYNSTQLLSDCMNRSQLSAEDYEHLVDSMLVIKPLNFRDFLGFGDGAIR